MKTSLTLVSVRGGWPDDSPPRSACFGLPPQGESGASYESLASYFRRLSAYHGIFPRAFADRAVRPLFHVQEMRTLHFSLYRSTMNGASGSAAAWANALEKPTMRTDLTPRTLLPLRTLIPLIKLLSSNVRFCPDCFGEDESAGRQQYSRLLWSIHCVEACPLRNTLLETAPEAPKHKRYTLWLPGFSRIDGTSLANRPPTKARNEQVRSAQLVAQLLD
ncbi:TniQ family protein [Paraburkholderia guartelaensis]|uniref:TniQ family protein n=1 Tax=Paraburkholderia guartelaensis TaxID=2546446 RepID=UPI0038BB85D4